jgi:hypothetical protein
MRRPQVARMRAMHGRDRVLAEYDWGSLAAKLEEVWRDAANKASVEA